MLSRRLRSEEGNFAPGRCLLVACFTTSLVLPQPGQLALFPAWILPPVLSDAFKHNGLRSRGGREKQPGAEKQAAALAGLSDRQNLPWLEQAFFLAGLVAGREAIETPF